MANNAASVQVSATLESAGFETAAQRARRVFGEQMAGIQRDASRTRGAVEGITKGVGNIEAGLSGFSKSTSAALGQVGFQLQDIIVQLQGGARPLQVFVQQGSQIAGAFGPIGAILGTIGSAAAIAISAILGFNEANEGSERSASDAAAALKKLNESSEEYHSALEKLLPLQKAYLENQIAIANANKRAAESEDNFAPEEAHKRQRGQTNPFNRYIAPPGQTDPYVSPRLDSQFGGIGGGDLSSELREALRQAQERARRAQDAIRFAGATAAVGKFETKPPYEASDQYKEAERLNKELARESKQRDQIIRQLEQQADAAKRLADATGEGAYAAKLAEIASDDQRRILQASQTLTGKQLEQAKKLSSEIARLERQRAAVSTALPSGKSTDPNSLRRQAEREGFDASGNLLPIDKNKATSDAERFAKLQQDILIEPWRNVASEVQGITQDMFDQVLEDGKVSFGSLADSFTDVFRQTASGALAAVVNAPIQQAVAQLGAKLSDPNSGFGATLLQFTQDNPVISGLAVGGATGSVFSSLLGQNGKYAGVGGAVGGAAGGYAGSALMPFLLTNPYTAPLAPFAPLIGSVLGGLGGGALGGLFGGENNLGNDRSTQTYSSGQGKIVYSDRSFSQGNRNITSGILGEVQTLQEALKDLGASFSDFNLRVEAGNKSGIAVNGVKYDTAQDALKGAIEQLLGARTGGLTTTQQTILANTKGENAQQIGQDLAFGETYDKLIRGGTQFDQALQALYETFRNATTEAAKLGLSTEALTQAHNREFAEVNRQKEQSQRGIYEQLAAARGDTSLGTQLFMLETRMRELAKAAADLGIPLETVTEAHREAARRITETYYENIQAMQAQQRGLQQSILDARRGAVGAVDQYLDPIRAALGSQGIGRGVYAGTVTTASAVDEFRALLGMAREGDASALSQLSGAGQAAVQAARQTYGAGTEFAKVFREIEAGLQSERGQLEAKRDEVLAQIGTYTEQTVDELVRLRIESIAEFQRQFERLSSDIRAALEGAN